VSPDLARPVSSGPPVGAPSREADSAAGPAFAALLAQAAPRPAAPPAAAPGRLPEAPRAPAAHPASKPAVRPPGERPKTPEWGRSNGTAPTGAPAPPPPGTSTGSGLRTPTADGPDADSRPPAAGVITGAEPGAPAGSPPNDAAGPAHPSLGLRLAATLRGGADRRTGPDATEPPHGEHAPAQPLGQDQGSDTAASGVPRAPVGELAYGDLGTRPVGAFEQPFDAAAAAAAARAAGSPPAASPAAAESRLAAPPDTGPSPSGTGALAGLPADALAADSGAAAGRGAAQAIDARALRAAGARGAAAASPGGMSFETVASAADAAPPGAASAPATRAAGTARPATSTGSAALASEPGPLERAALEPAPRSVTQAVLEATGARSAGLADAVATGPARAADPHMIGLEAAVTDALATGPSEPGSDAPPARFPITVPFSDPRFPGAIAERVTWLLRAGLQAAELTLNPQELGPIRIELSLEGSAASIGFSAAHAETRSAIEQALPRLREMLAGQGLQLGGAQVDGGGQRRGGDSPGARAGRSEPRALLPAEAMIGSETAIARAARAAGRVDLFA